MRAKRTRKYLKQLEADIVEIWKRAAAQRFHEGRGNRPDLYRPQPKGTLETKAKALVRHCLDKPVSENG